MRTAGFVTFVSLALIGCGGGGGGETSSVGATTATHVVTSLASVPSNGAVSLAVANGRVYFTDQNASSVHSVPVAGGAVTTHVTMFESFWPVRYAGDTLYLLGRRNAGGLFSIADSSVDATSADLIWRAAFESSPVWLTLDESNIYWATDDYDVATTRYKVRIYAIPLAGGAVRLVGTIAGQHALRIAHAGSDLYVAAGAASGGGIFRLPKSGGPALALFTTTADGPTDIWVKNNLLYFFYSGLYVYDLATGASKPLWTSPTQVDGELYVDDAHIYWTEANRSGRVEFGGGTGAVRRIPIGSGPVETLYTGTWSWDIIGDATSIYWAAGLTILKTTK